MWLHENLTNVGGVVGVALVAVLGGNAISSKLFQILHNDIIVIKLHCSSRL